MSKRYLLLQATTGLNNKVDPARLKYNPENGVTELAEAVNIDIDSTGRPRRRKGFSRVGLHGTVHSLYPTSDFLYFVSDGVIHAMNEAEGITDLCGISDERTSYETVGDKVYFSNMRSRGIIIGTTVNNWDKQDYVGPKTYRTYQSPPPGNFLLLFNGRMLIGAGDVIYASERFAYSWFDMARDYMQVGADLRMLAKVRTGLYVGVNGRILYYHGKDFSDVGLNVVSDETIITGTEQMIQGSTFPDYRINEPIIIAATNKGIVLLGPDGFYKNLTEDKVVYEAGKFGGSVLIDKRYIFSIEP